MEHLFSVSHISKSFDGKKKEKPVEVLRDISMDISEKEFVVILGPSGCGKSTFLKILGGVLDANEGSIVLNGHDYGRELPREALHNFGFVFQSNNLLQWRTAEKNLRFMLEMMHLKGEKWDKRVDEMLEIVGLLDYKNVYPHELTGGMKQRVGIARALVHDPEILILDQPLGALDAITRRMLSFEILNIWKKTQKTVIMVTNNVDEAVLLANRILIFSDLPASITHEIKVDIPIEERGADIAQNARYNELRAQINEIVRSTM
ncbi:MAG: ABC transporter ATP-binding protein [Oscillospiraceae bacterium]